MSGSIQDITKERQAAERLRDSEARWRSLTESSPDHVLTLDPDLNIEFCNFAPPGLTVEQFIGTPLYRYAPIERQEEIERILRRVLDTEEIAHYETEYLDGNKSAIYFESRVAPRIVDNQVCGLTVVSRDVSRRKLTELSLQTTESTLRSILETAFVHIMSISLDCKLTYVNRVVEGLKLEDVIGRSAYDFIPEAFHETFRHAMKQVAATQERV